MDPITIAMALAQFAPIITKWITGSDEAASVAGKVVGIAETITGKQGDAALQEIQGNPELALRFKEVVMANETELEKVFLADRADARARDAAILATGKRNFRADSMYFLAVLVIVFLVYAVWKDPNVNEYMKGIVTLLLGRFLGYLDNIYNYEFGTTRVNRDKDATIRQLSR